MSNRFRKIALYLLLALMPLQSVASAVHGLACAEPSRQRSDGNSPGHDKGFAHHAHDGAGGQAGLDSHECCQHYSPGAVQGIAPGPRAEMPSYQPGQSGTFVSHFPERLKRPPLAIAA